MQCKLWLLIQRGVEQLEKRYGFGSHSKLFQLQVQKVLGMPLPLRQGYHALHGVRCFPLISSLSTDSVPATFMLLPNRMGLSANAYMQTIRGHAEQCNILGTIPLESVTFRRQEFWIGMQ